MNQPLSQQQVITKLKELHERGYRYIARDQGTNYLICFSLKPKKYRDINSWGYVNPDVPGVLGAYPIKNIDITEVDWSNRSAVLIADFLS